MKLVNLGIRYCIACIVLNKRSNIFWGTLFPLHILGFVSFLVRFLLLVIEIHHSEIGIWWVATYCFFLICIRKGSELGTRLSFGSNCWFCPTWCLGWSGDRQFDILILFYHFVGIDIFGTDIYWLVWFRWSGYYTFIVPVARLNTLFVNKIINTLGIYFHLLFIFSVHRYHSSGEKKTYHLRALDPTVLVVFSSWSVFFR